MGGGGGGEDGEFGFQIAPMVDVVFVLLLFFMACAGQTVTEGLFNIKLPSTDKGDGAPKPPLVIDIDPNGGIAVNGEMKLSNPNDRDIPVLDSYLVEWMKKDDECPVIIRPAPDAKHERLIDVLNSCRKAKVKNLTFG